MNSHDAIAVARKARAAARPAGRAPIADRAETAAEIRHAADIEPADGARALVRRLRRRGPLGAVQALLSAPARPLAEESSRHIADLRRQLAEVEQRLWLQANHIAHLVDSLAQTTWLDSNHVHAELRQIRQAVGAPDGAPSKQDSHSAMLMELLLQQQALGLTVAHLAARLDALSAAGDTGVASDPDHAAVRGADRSQEAAP